MGILLEDDSVYIRPYTRKDSKLLYKAVSESLNELLPWMVWANPQYSEKDANLWVSACERSWARDSEYDFGIFSKRTHRLLGGVGLNAIFHEHRFCNMGYWVRTDELGKGIATRAARLLCRFAFTYKHFNRVEIVAAKDNIASQRVAEKIPAQCEGVLRQRLVIADKPQDAIIYSILVSDWRCWELEEKTKKTA